MEFVTGPYRTRQPMDNLHLSYDYFTYMANCDALVGESLTFDVVYYAAGTDYRVENFVVTLTTTEPKNVPDWEKTEGRCLYQLYGMEEPESFMRDANDKEDKVTLAMVSD